MGMYALVPGLGDQLQLTSSVRAYVKSHHVGTWIDDYVFGLSREDAQILIAWFVEDLKSGTFKLETGRDLRQFRMLTTFVDNISDWAYEVYDSDVDRLIFA